MPPKMVPDWLKRLHLCSTLPQGLTLARGRFYTNLHIIWAIIKISLRFSINSMTKPVQSHCSKTKTHNTLHLDLYNQKTNIFFQQTKNKTQAMLGIAAIKAFGL
jgi:hypothetical protein